MSSPSQALSSLPVGAKGRVLSVSVPPEQKGRLLEMGVLPGTTLELIRFAPLGDPVEIKLRGYHLTLRRQEADLILVSPL